jgi:hypothetical protein
MKMTAMEIMAGTEDASIAKRERRKALLRSGLIILAIAILATLPGWFPGMIYGGAGRSSAMRRMAVEYAAQRLKVGEIPLWNPNVGLGEPVVGNGAIGVFFPTIMLHMVLPAKWAGVVSAVVMMWLAGFGVVMLMAGSASRTGSQSEPYIAVFMGAIFMLAIACLEFLQISSMNALALLPWAVLASGMLLWRMTAARLVGITLLFLVIFLAGDNAASVGVVLACLIFLIWNLSRKPRRWVGFVAGGRGGRGDGGGGAVDAGTLQRGD